MLSIFVTIVYAVIVYTIGYGLLKFLRIPFSSSFTQLFACLFAGILLWVWVSAVIFTRGNTIMNVILIPIGFMLWEARKNKLILSQYIKVPYFSKSLIPLLVVLVVCTIFHYFLYLSYYELYPVVSNIDSVFYTRVGRYLVDKGIETTNLDYVLQKHNHPSPYHYFLPWLQESISFVFGVNSYLARKMIATSMLFSTIYIGVLGILQVVRNNATLRWYHYVMCILVIFIKPLALGVFSNLFSDYLGHFYTSIIQLPKHASMFIVFVGIALLILHKQYNFALYFALFIPIFYISAAPAIFTTLGIIFLCNLYKSFLPIRKYTLFLAMILTFASFLLFYGLQYSDNYVVNEGGKYESFFSRFENTQFIGVLVKDFFKVILKMIVGFFPLLCVSFLYRKDIIGHLKANISVFYLTCFTLICVVSGFISWQFLYNIDDSVQFITGVLSTCANLLCLMWIFLVLEIILMKKHLIILSAFVLWLGIFIYSATKYVYYEARFYTQKFSPEYLNVVNQYANQFSEIGAYFSNQPISELYFYSYREFLITYENPKQLVAMNICEQIPDKVNKHNSHYVPLFTFYQYVTAQKQNQTFVALGQSKKDFIKKYHVNHAFVDKSVQLDSTLIPYAKVLATDAYSGGSFVWFKDIP